MSRRTRHFRGMRGKDETATAQAMLAHNRRKAVSVGRMTPKRATGAVGTLPMRPETAQRIATALHRAK